MISKHYLFSPQSHEGHPVLSSAPNLAAKSLTLWARLLCPLAALSGLKVHEYVVTPAALPALKSRFVSNPRQWYFLRRGAEFAEFNSLLLYTERAESKKPRFCCPPLIRWFRCHAIAKKRVRSFSLTGLSTATEKTSLSASFASLG
jgi:hypothetical protein